MLPCNRADAWWTSWPVPLQIWWAPENFQRVCHASWLDFPGTFHHEVPAHGPSYSDYAGVSMGSDFHDPVIERLIPRESRRFFLNRSAYDLVAAYPYLTLTDRRLLGWYLNLSPEDRKLIQDEGGFFQFLQRHPALELNRHQIYVKYSTSPTQPAMTASQQVSRGHVWFDWSVATKESPSECNSSGSNQMIGPAYSDRSIIQAVELAQARLSQAEENATKHVCQDLHGTKYTADDDTLLSFENQSDTFHLEDKSILVNDSGVHSCPVATNSGDTLAAGAEISASYQCATKVKTAEKHTSPMPSVSTCDAMVGTELVLCPSVFTQTKDLETADKHINTEVYMADLDYFDKEFIKLMKAQEVKKERKEKTKSVDCKLRGECECMERAKQAELQLLALQYSVCKQHCWRLYCTSAEGNPLTLGAKDPPLNNIHVLQKLELDYNEMKSKIQAGAPLQQLKPLSVDSGEIVTGGNYIPAQIIGEVLGEVSSWSSQEPQKLHTPGGDGAGCPDNQSREVLQKENNKTRRAATLFPQDEVSVGQEVNIGEKWYDAEEDLASPGAAVAAAVTQDLTLVTVDAPDESASEEAKSSVLCVSNLPISVTESDMMLLFEKYHPSEVSISVLKDLRFAIVILSGPESADAAVRELNGCRMQGCTLHLKHISGTGSSSQASARKPDSSQDAVKPQTSEMDSDSTESQLITQPLDRPSIRSRKVVCISPTAKGSFVPQNYGTMSSFETLMAAPPRGWKAKHQGVLYGLPPRTMQEMVSDLPARP